MRKTKHSRSDQVNSFIGINHTALGSAYISWKNSCLYWSFRVSSTYFVNLERIAALFINFPCWKPFECVTILFQHTWKQMLYGISCFALFVSLKIKNFSRSLAVILALVFLFLKIQFPFFFQFKGFVKVKKIIFNCKMYWSTLWFSNICRTLLLHSLIWLVRWKADGVFAS